MGYGVRCRSASAPGVTCGPRTSMCPERWSIQPTSTSVSTMALATTRRAETFDLVHARLVLVHVVERERALLHLVKALRPGGGLLGEDADPALQPLPCLDVQGPEQELANKIRMGFRALMSSRGADLAFRRRLRRLLREAGLCDVSGDCYFSDRVARALEAGNRDGRADPRPPDRGRSRDIRRD